MKHQEDNKFGGEEPSLKNISDYHRPLSGSKKRLILSAMAVGLSVAFLLYILAAYLS